MRRFQMAFLVTWIACSGITGAHAQENAESPRDSQSSPARFLDYRSTGRVPRPAIVAPASQDSSASYKLVKLRSDNFCHLDLMFEDYPLERHGARSAVHERRQTAVSGVRFFTKGILLPLNLARRKHLRGRSR